MKSILFLILLALLVIGCPGQKNPIAQDSAPADFKVILERSVCFGTCPDYKLTILPNGSVTFEGREFVKKKGLVKAQISQQDLKKIASAIEEASFFSLKDRYVDGQDGCPEVWTDNPRVILSITHRDKSKTINHDHGCQEKDTVFPKALTELENKIDEIVGTKRWIK